MNKNELERSLWLLVKHANPKVKPTVYIHPREKIEFLSYKRYIM